MTLAESTLLLICCAAVFAVLGPQRRRSNTNPPPVYKRPPAPPAPPPIRNQRNTDKVEVEACGLSVETITQKSAAPARRPLDCRVGRQTVKRSDDG